MDKQPGHTVHHGRHKANKGEGEVSRSTAPIVKKEVNLSWRRKSISPLRTRGRRGAIVYTIDEEERQSGAR